MTKRKVTQLPTEKPKSQYYDEAIQDRMIQLLSDTYKDQPKNIEDTKPRKK